MGAKIAYKASMIRVPSALLLLVCGALLLPACKKPSDTSASDSASAAPAASAPAAAATPAPPPPAASPATSASAAPTPTPGPVSNLPLPGGSIDACCAALAAASRGRGPAAGRAKQAMEICPGIAQLVRQGATSRAAGLTQVKSALTGGPIPAACN
jgi:hypothetical protein